MRSGLAPRTTTSPTIISDPEGDDPLRLTLLDSEIDVTSGSGWLPPHQLLALHRSQLIPARRRLRRRMPQRLYHRDTRTLHGFGEHASGLRVLRNGTLRNNTIWCEPNPDSDEDMDGIPDPDGGCSGNMTMYQEFGTPHNNLIEHNYFPAGLFWYSVKFNGNDNGNIRIINNRFGMPKPGAGVADDWDAKATNIWSGNVFTDGSASNIE